MALGIGGYPRGVHRWYHEINEELWKQFEDGGTTQAELRARRFERLLQHLPARRQASANLRGDTLSGYYLKALGGKGYLLPFARTVLSALSKAASVVLLTNGIAEVQRERLVAARIGQHFKDVIISGEVGLAKPDPRIFALGLERLEIPREEVLCVGDSPSSDIRGGHAAGLATCWVSGSADSYPADEPAPDYRISDLRQLIAFLP